MIDASAVERIAARYEGRWDQGWARGKLSGDPVYGAVLALLPEQGRLLDVGCGEGYLLAAARELRPGLRLTGLDHDERRLAVARRALPDEVDLRSEDARAAKKGSFDVVTCLDVLHYLPPGEQDALVAALAGLLAPGGLFVVRDAELGRGLRSWLTAASERCLVAVGRHKGQGVYLRSREAQVASLEAAGLGVEVQPCQEGTPFANLLYLGRARASELSPGEPFRP